MAEFSLRFPLDQVAYWSTQYDYSEEAHLEHEVGPRVREQGYCTREEFMALCEWKSPRVRPRCASNAADFVEAVTRTALSTPNERLRIEVLTLLTGVSWPTASVVLHWGHNEPYPILDFRALWSLGFDSPPRYQFDFWWNYTQHCRRLAEEAGVSMRVLDRALWAYSEKTQ